MIEYIAIWRLFSKNDFKEFSDSMRLQKMVSYGVGKEYLEDWTKFGKNGHIHASETTITDAIHSLDKHIRNLNFEHGEEGKIPRANEYRPYRLTIDGKLAAAIVLRASEAFNLCEIDVFLTTEFPGIKRLEPTRAALLFAFSDAVKSGGSMAVQFTKSCAPNGLPRHVQAIAEQVNVELKYVEKGALSPNEVRELFLRLCGLPDKAQEIVREFANRRLFSIERICQLVASGIWPIDDAAFVLLGCPYPELLLGEDVEASSRLLTSHAIAVGRIAILWGLFDRAFRYIDPVRENEKMVIECKQYHRIQLHFESDLVAVTYSMPDIPKLNQITLNGWSPRGSNPLVIPAMTQLVALPRSRSRDEIRIYLKQDLESAHYISERRRQMVLLIYPFDYRRLSESERIEAEDAAKKRNVIILACPESFADLEAETRRRLRIGRTVRQ